MKTRKHTRRSGLLLAAVAAVALMGGSAFTASNSNMASSVQIGYGETTVSGATLNDLTYTYSGDKSEITGITVVLNGDTTGSTVEVLLDDDTDPSSATAATCGAGSYDSTTETTYNCTSSFSTASLAKTSVVVTSGSNVTA